MNAAEVVSRHDPGHIAVVDGARQVSYGELDELVDRTASGLRTRGVTDRDQVLVVAGTELAFVVAFLAVLRAGAIAVPLNPRAPVAELARRLEALDPRATLVGDVPPELPPGMDPVLGVAGRADDDIEVADSAPTGATAGGGSEPGALLHTSGVTASPQLASLSHANLIAARRGLASQAGAELDPATTALCALPLYHVFGLNSLLGAVLEAGGTVVLAREYDVATTVELAARHSVDAVTAVPQMWKAWAAAGDDLAAAFGRVRRATSGSTHLPPAVRELARDRLGLDVVEGYGLTETAGTITRGSLPSRPGSVGRPLGAAEIRLVDDAGYEAAPGDRGQLWVRGPQVAAGYWRDPEATRAAFGSGGWHHTGDVGVIDDLGELSIVDRHKDIVIVSGFNVSPAEVEDVLVAHPGVLRAAVVGQPDATTGERVVAHIVAAEGSLAFEDLIDHCRRHLARYKVPSHIEVASSLPLTTGGKSLRRTVS